MPRRKRFCPANIPSHVHKRGNNKLPCFVDEDDFKFFAVCLAHAADRYRVRVHAWVFMTNHFHLLVTPEQDQGVSKMMQSIGANYVKYFNEKFERSGTLFEGRFKNHVVETERYLILCQRYIELNPVRAGMVRDVGDYRWSSYHAHAHGVAPSFWQPHDIYQALSDSDLDRRKAYRRSFGTRLEDPLVDQIRMATRSGIPLGSDNFREKFGC